MLKVSYSSVTGKKIKKGKKSNTLVEKPQAFLWLAYCSYQLCKYKINCWMLHFSKTFLLFPHHEVTHLQSSIKGISLYMMFILKEISYFKILVQRNRLLLCTLVGRKEEHWRVEISWTEVINYWLRESKGTLNLSYDLKKIYIHRERKGINHKTRSM